MAALATDGSTELSPEMKTNAVPHEVSWARKYEEFREQFLIVIREISKYYGYEVKAVDSAMRIILNSGEPHRSPPTELSGNAQ
ncbi:hypothetical protein KIN20_025034 [Parelaphostrongylus tenuis]|uniref:Uncharacterized protein n=1 Tax=Parelaphostrongylus tenuis TaxID=148309 RepID=A0AAD5N899_PARTN|nr:hypothetical protein KIN20_025034 [Parelaphostrongylus tenuis]